MAEGQRTKPATQLCGSGRLSGTGEPVPDSGGGLQRGNVGVALGLVGGGSISRSAIAALCRGDARIWRSAPVPSRSRSMRSPMSCRTTSKQTRNGGADEHPQRKHGTRSAAPKSLSPRGGNGPWACWTCVRGVARRGGNTGGGRRPGLAWKAQGTPSPGGRRLYGQRRLAACIRIRARITTWLPA